MHNLKDSDERELFGFDEGQEGCKLAPPSCRYIPCGEMLGGVSELETSELTGFLLNKECNVLLQACLEELVPLPHP
jgi:hypothetical protein